jgi:hypothetical protein
VIISGDPSQAHVNPKAKKVQDYLGSKAYRKEFDIT